MNEKHKEILQTIQTRCLDGKELDLADMIRLDSSLTMQELLQVIPVLEQQGYIEVIQIDMCCGADYILTGITKQGIDYLQSLL
ncbi:MAG: hypothetical protein PHU31_00565 [Anaerotignum sp.]|nr:hypothetical protein [Anaerotignum sp.]